jgi:hypothetical protein
MGSGSDVSRTQQEYPSHSGEWDAIVRKNTWRAIAIVIRVIDLIAFGSLFMLGVAGIMWLLSGWSFHTLASFAAAVIVTLIGCWILIVRTLRIYHDYRSQPQELRLGNGKLFLKYPKAQIEELDIEKVHKCVVRENKIQTVLPGLSIFDGWQDCTDTQVVP